MSDGSYASSRHSDPTLLGLARLDATLHGAASAQEREEWWHLVERTQSSIDGDPRAGKADLNAMKRLRASVTEVHSALRDGLHPDYSGARSAVFGVQRLLEARTTGIDGYPLR